MPETKAVLLALCALVAPLTPGLQAHFTRLALGRFRRGLNDLVFTAPPGGQALVDRIVFTPVESHR